MLALSDGLPAGKKFDAVVVDEAQDFADAWWPVVLAALKDPVQGRLTATTELARSIREVPDEARPRRVTDRPVGGIRTD